MACYDASSGRIRCLLNLIKERIRKAFMIDEVKSTKLANGISVLTEHMPGLRSITAGIWVRRGSRHETRELNGICHFIEHAVFKGTARRTARDIAIESDRLGGNLDAYTTHEMTGFAIKFADTALPQAFDLLSDIVSQPRFDEEDLLREQKVILEEMKMVEDSPEELLGELFNAAYFPDHSLGRPIEGTVETVTSFDHHKTLAFHAREFSRCNLVIAGAGNIDHAQLVELAERAFLNGQASDEAAPSQTGPAESPWPAAKSEDRYAASMLASIVGGGTSSRLWQKIREERGLAYSVGAGGNTFSDVGVFTIYAGTSPTQMNEVLDLALAEDQAVSSILLGLESSSARVGALARQEIVHGRRISPEEIIKRIEAVTAEQIQHVARTCLTSEGIALGALGNLNGFQVDRSRLEI